jgi:hypothetical protein
MRRLQLVGVLILVAFPPARAQSPAGLPTSVSQGSIGTSGPSGAAADATGRLLVAWNRALGGIWNQVEIQAFDPDGSPYGAAMPISGPFTGWEGWPTVAADPAGGFLVVWQELQGAGLQARRVSSTGQPLEGFSLGAGSFAQAPVVAIAGNGAIGACWFGGNGLQGRIYAPGGQPLVPAFPIPTSTIGVPLACSITALSGGDFVFVWDQPPAPSTPTDVFMRVFRQDGTPASGQITVPEVTLNSQILPSVAADDAGHFLVAWGSSPNDGQGGGVFARRFSSNGVALGGQFRVAEPLPTPEVGLDTAVTFRPGDGYLVGWAWRTFNPGHSVNVRRLDPLGAPIGPEIRVSAERNETQNRLPRVAWTATGFAVAWVHKLWVGPYEAFLQRYELRPAVRGDFDSDARADLLFHNVASNRFVVWTMNGLERKEGAFLAPPAPEVPDWDLVATPDLDADGSADLLWHRPADDGATAWLMKERELRQELNVAGLPALAWPWRVLASADLDGDQRPDLLLRNETTGELRIRALQGATWVGDLATDPPVQDTAWALGGAADLDADGYADLLWRHQTSGELRVWLMRRNRRLAEAQTVPSAVANLDWQVAALADYSGDEDIDVVWRNVFSGAIVVWTMDGLTRISGDYTTPATAPTSWRIAGPR